MATTPAFADLLHHIDERAAAFRRAVAATPDLSVPVPGCPEWTMLDLVAHLGGVHRSWAAAVRAGDPSTQPPEESRGSLAPSDDPLSWSADATRLLLTVLQEFGPERACWTWWDPSHAPRTAAAVARHQVQEAAVHAFDAQQAQGDPERIPDGIAVDSVDEFLAVTVPTMQAWQPWPHEPAVLTLRADEGAEWTVRLAPDGVGPVSVPPDGADAIVSGAAHDLILALYDRVPVERVRTAGDSETFGRLCRWADTE